MKRVVITGLGAVTPLGVGAAALHQRWAAGESGIADGRGACRDFDPEATLSRKEIRRSDRVSQLALAAADEAVAHAGWSGGIPYEPDRVACILGTGIGGLETLENEQEKLVRDGEAARMSPLGIPLFMPNGPAAAVAMRHELHGQVYGIVSACAAGANAIGQAMRAIQIGDADAAVTGGAEATLTPLAFASFGAMQALSPTGISRPFDARRDGFVMGEGAGVLVLEEKEAAERRGAPILGELLGYASTADAYHLTAPDPSGGPARRAIELALKDAGRSPEDLAYVNAHGTSTPLNDAAETVALKAALGEERAKRIPVSSTKSAIGHLLGAAGAVEAIATVQALTEHLAPPTLGYEVLDPELDLDYVPGEARALANGSGPLVGISNSFGFGGHNAVLVLAGGQ